MKLNNIDYNGELVEYKMSKNELFEFINTHLPKEDLKNINLDEIKDLCFSLDQEPEKNSKNSNFIYFGIFIIILILIGLGLWKIFELIIQN